MEPEVIVAYWVLRSGKDIKISFRKLHPTGHFWLAIKKIYIKKNTTRLSALSEAKELKTFQKLAIMFVVFVVSS